jgi:hypothetical protein
MRIIIAAITLVLVMGVALAQGVGGMGGGMGGGKGKRDRHNAATKTEDSAKKKADEEAYKKALQSIPDSNQKIDPWKGMR